MSLIRLEDYRPWTSEGHVISIGFVPRKPHPALKLLGAKILERRDECGWTQERLAAEADLDSSYIGDIERGQRNPSLLVVVRVARALRVRLVDLLADVDP